MAYKVIYRTLEVVCDTFAEVDALADHATGEKRPTKRLPRQVTASAALTAETPVAGFVQGLNKIHRNIMTLLLSASRPLTDTEMRKELSIESNNQLAGFMAGITRAAKKATLKKEDVLKVTVLSNKPGARAYTYTVPTKLANEIRDAM